MWESQTARAEAARAVQPSETDQDSRSGVRSDKPASASPTRATAPCLTASKGAAFKVTRRTEGENTVHEAVVKSWRRVPTANTTSASAASSLPEEEPVMPRGPACRG